MNNKAINYLNNLHRRSIRLKGYDYSQACLYFITICCQGKACLFGEVVKGKIVLYNSGSTISKWYFELENKFTDIRCHEMIVMPNHFHCIIENVSVGADLRVCPDSIPNERYKDVNNTHGNYTKGEHTYGNYTYVNNTHANNTHDNYTKGEHTHGNYTKGEHTGSPLHQVLQWFKTMTTNEYIRGVKTLGWQPFNGKLWQRNYYEHIIRDEQSYKQISEYIINNPTKWIDDKFYSE